MSNKEKTLTMMGINCKGINKKEFVEYWKKEFEPLLEKKIKEQEEFVEYWKEEIEPLLDKKINELKEKRCK